jgi:hypothetical protein
LLYAALLALGGTAAIIAWRGVEAARDGTADPSLASRMGSDALEFSVQLAYVFPIAATLAAVGFIVGRRLVEWQILAVASFAVLSTLLFDELEIGQCSSAENLFDLFMLVAPITLAVPIGVVSARRGLGFLRHVGALLPLVATAMVLAHVQLWHCAGPSQQIGREAIAPMVALVLLGPIMVLASTLAWLWTRRRYFRERKAGRSR